MASKYEIEMDFKAALRQADKIDNIASKLSRTANSDYQNTLQGISSAWKGDNANIYINKSSVLVGRMSNTASRLNEAADTIRRIAKNIYDAEMRAWEIAQRRDYQ